jgi:hypothetical protein
MLRNIQLPSLAIAWGNKLDGRVSRVFWASSSSIEIILYTNQELRDLQCEQLSIKSTTNRYTNSRIKLSIPTSALLLYSL